MLAYQRHTGMWISGLRRGRTRWVAIATATLAAVLMLGAVWLRAARGLAWAPLAAAPFVAVVVTIAGFVWEAAYRADLGVEPGAGRPS
jgi:hypothetical protein